MLYLIYGENTFEARRKVREITANLLSREPQAELWRVTPEDFNEEKFADIAGGQNLFGRKSVAVLDGLFEGNLSDFLAKYAKEMSESKNVYIILEEKIEAKLVKKISKFAQKKEKFVKLKEREVEKWTANEAKKKSVNLSTNEAAALAQNLNFDLWTIESALELGSLGENPELKKFFYEPFKLADLFSQKNKYAAYKHFHENLASGVASEEMFWKLWWQVKTLLNVLPHKEAGLNVHQIKESTGLHPFVVQKSFFALSKFTRTELERIWDELFLLWREGRADKSALVSGLERTILTL